MVKLIKKKEKKNKKSFRPKKFQRRKSSERDKLEAILSYARKATG